MNTLFIPGTLRLVVGLGTTCTIGYGTLFYSFSLLSAEFSAHFSWSSSFVFGIFSLGIFLSGLFAPVFGRLIDRFGARYPMTIGSLLAALGLLALSQVQNHWQFAIALAFTEVVSVLVVYETAFVALTKALNKDARYTMTQITLMAGFASTIFWPLIAWLLTFLDWRCVYIILALCHLLLCLPIHWCVVRRQEAVEQKGQPPQSRSASVSLWIRLGLAVALGLAAFAITALQIHLFTIFDQLNIEFSIAVAVAIGALVGPAQVIARVLDMLCGRRLSPIVLGLISFGLMILGILGMLLSSTVPQSIWLFAIGFGAGQGLSYIVRGAVPLYLFGASQYGYITGQLNGVRMAFTAVAPFSFAFLMQSWGLYPALCLLLLLMGISTIILLVLSSVFSGHSALDKRVKPPTE
ncbi:MAG: MFS transporter [Pseudomonadota bacterium]